MRTRSSLEPVSVRGRYFWEKGNRFFVRGVAYQLPDTRDPISDDRLPQLRHDLSLFKELGINTLYVYSVDNTLSHDKAMSLLEREKIYVVTAVSTPGCCINRMDPYASYNTNTLTSLFQIVDMMARYPNTLSLLVANSLINNRASMASAPVLKATVRDIKKYMTMKNAADGQRILPIGYGAQSTIDIDATVFRYLSSGDASNTVDFWACCNYTWAGESNMQMSGYNSLITQFQNTRIPVFFSEYGVKLNATRLFQETRAIYSTAMSRVFSGGCVYEFWQSANNYGLVELVEPKPEEQSDLEAKKRRKALRRANDGNVVAEKRETGLGLILVYHDFVNYKNALAATRNIEREWEDGELGSGRPGNAAPMHWPWEPQYTEPDSCVDWEQIEEELGSAV